MLRRRLAKHGYEMIVAEDGQKGVEAALREKPDLILMDLSLPVLTGWEAAQQLKQSAQTQAIPIIALSAHALEGERDKALAAGCDEFESKPVDLAAAVGEARAAHSRRERLMAQSRPRILVVDDVDDNVFTLERRLKQFLDPEITSAGNGACGAREATRGSLSISCCSTSRCPKWMAWRRLSR